MSSDRSSSSPEPTLSSKKASTQAKEKSKKNGGQPAVVHTPHGKNEGTNIDSAYRPPEGMKLVDGEHDEDFDWESLKDDEDLELWIVRVPEGVKAKHLDGLKLDEPSSSKSAQIGSLVRKHISYDIWSLADGGEPNDTIGAEELDALSPLFPRKKKGTKFYGAPDLPARHIVLSARPPKPTPELSESTNTDMSWSTQQNPPRPSYPKEMLKGRFMPAGAL
ncbi:hypothetical protein PHLGIDRAFT_86954, partial [Phlebiopsis gigantea 11061_1 CR5-6]